ncbi:MAG: sulfite exporter TauE/SafE family protein [Actinomycetota bacterium]
MRTLDFILAGIAAGAFSGALGLGGALVATPLLRFLGVPPYLALGTTVPAMLPTTLTGAWTYHRQGLVDTRSVSRTGAPAGAGAVAGAFLTRQVNGHVLMFMTAGLLFFLALRSLPAREKPKVLPSPRRSTGPLFALGLAAGFLAGLLGIGGGFLLVPAFIRLLRFPTKLALGTSLAVIAWIATPNLIAQGLVGNVDWRIAFLLGIGMVPGARMGALVTIRSSEQRLRSVVALVVAVLAVAYAGLEVAALSSG